MRSIILGMLGRANNLACAGHHVAARRIRQAAAELSHAA